MLNSSIIAFAMRVIGTGLWLAFTVVVARGLGVDDFGAVFFVVNASLVGAQLVLGGYNVVVLRYASTAWHQGDKAAFVGLLREGRITVLAFGGLVCAGTLLYGAADPPPPLILDPIRIILTLALSVITGMMTLHMDALRSCDQMGKALFGTTIFRTVGSLFCVLPFVATASLSVEQVLLTYLLVLCLAALLEVWWLRQLGGSGHRWVWRLPHLKQGLAIWPGELALVLVRRSTTLILGAQNDLVAVAMFVAAERVAMLSDFLTDAVRLAIGPQISIASRGTPQALQDACERASALMFVVGMLGASGTAAIAWPILWLFGGGFTEAFGFVLSLIIAQMSWAILGPTAIVANMLGLGGLRSRLSSLATFVMVLAQLALYPMFGAAGVVWALVIATWGLNYALWLTIRTRKSLSLGLLGTPPSRILAAFRSEVRSLTGKGR